MFPLFESIKVYKGKVCNAKWHNERMERTFKNYFKIDKTINVLDYFDSKQITEELVKFRITYNEKEVHVEYNPYQAKNIQSLQVVHLPSDANYDFKFSDRNILNKAFAQKGEADGVLLIQNGLVTDTSYSNILFLKNGNWYTPKKPLLKGTQREKLLHMGRIQTAEIRLEDLNDYESFTLINAMNELGEREILEVKRILF